MRVLITGTGGQIVTSLLERGRAAAGMELIAIGRPDLDLEIPGSAAAAVRNAAPDVLVNAAAWTAVDAAEDEPERAMRVNRDGAGELAAAALEAGAPIIQLSTDYVFDGSSDHPYAEDAPTRPLGAYGRSKLAGEEAVRRSNPRHMILRTAWVYSPFGANFVKTMLRVAREREVVNVVSDQRGNPSSALDLADGILHVLDAWREGRETGFGKTYHLAGSGEASWFDFAEAIFAEARALGLPAARVAPIATAEWPTRARRPANSRLDSVQFASDFGYRAPDWRASLKEVLRRLAKDAGS